MTTVLEPIVFSGDADADAQRDRDEEARRRARAALSGLAGGIRARDAMAAGGIDLPGASSPAPASFESVGLEPSGPPPAALTLPPELEAQRRRAAEVGAAYRAGGRDPAAVAPVAPRTRPAGRSPDVLAHPSLSLGPRAPGALDWSGPSPRPPAAPEADERAAGPAGAVAAARPPVGPDSAPAGGATSPPNG